MEILNYPHPILRFKTREVKKVDENFHEFADEMLATMRAEKGNGLSANQVGFPFRMFVIGYQDSDFCLINPVVRPFGKTKAKTEGCLSFLDVFIEIKRRAKCRLMAHDLYGNTIDQTVDGDLARIIMHEMDHLDGMLFIDRLTELQIKSIYPHLAAMDRVWNSSDCSFPAGAFNELLYDYCGVERPTI